MSLGFALHLGYSTSVVISAKVKGMKGSREFPVDILPLHLKNREIFSGVPLGVGGTDELCQCRIECPGVRLRICRL